MISILVVDDEQSMRDFLHILLKKEGYRVQTAKNADLALEELEKQQYHLVITDIRMPGRSGLDLLNEIKEKDPELPVVMITAFASPEDAVTAMKKGAFDYISKPFNVDEIKSVIKSATKKQTKTQPTIVKEKIDPFPEIVGNSPEIRKIFDMITRVAPTHANILIYGESGTGKELVAKAIHNKSSVAGNEFVPITCSAIPEELMESELFGHVKGSFTGAISDKDGLFSQADNGTAFLDEIGELSPIIQTKLLRVLQEREIKPVGGTRIIPINVRIIAATNKILEEEITAGKFREDLFFRLAVVPIRIPALRERKSDIPLLINHFLNKYSKLLRKDIREMSSYGMEVLMNYDFPGNVRELENIIERGVALETSNIILPENLTLSSHYKKNNNRTDQPLFQAAADERELFELGLEKILSNLEKKIISFALKKSGNSKMKAAELLRISFRSLRYKVKKYDIG